MASPAPSTASANAAPKQQEQITFRFCRECSNMLYPKEDRMTNKLMFACRTCQFSEEALSSCVFRNNMYNTVGETAGVTQDVGSDPTVGDPQFLYCTYCGRELDDGVRGEEEDEEEEEELEEEERDGEESKVTRVNVFDLSEMSRLEEDEDGETDGEPDNGVMNGVGDDDGDQQSSDGGRGGDSDHAYPERKTS